MNIIVILLIVLLLFGGLGGYGWHASGYAGGHYVGLGGGLIGIIVLFLVLRLLGVI